MKIQPSVTLLLATAVTQVYGLPKRGSSEDRQNSYDVYMSTAQGSGTPTDTTATCGGGIVKGSSKGQMFTPICPLSYISQHLFPWGGYITTTLDFISCINLCDGTTNCFAVTFIGYQAWENCYYIADYYNEWNGDLVDAAWDSQAASALLLKDTWTPPLDASS